MALTVAQDGEAPNCKPAVPPSTTPRLAVCRMDRDGILLEPSHASHCYPTGPNEVLVNLDIALPVRVRKLFHESDCHPAQWVGRTADGDVIYVRYRHGRLWIGLAPDLLRTPPTTLLQTGYGDYGDGYLSFRSLRRRTRGVVEWPKRTRRPGLTL